MTATYNEYRRALDSLLVLPAQTAAELDHARKEQERAAQLAQQAVSSAQGISANANKAIEAQLAAARGALEPLGKSNLIPPQIRPSGGLMAATRDDIAQAQQALAHGVNTLRKVVQDEIARIEAENERLAREATERERAAREAADRAAAARARRRHLMQAGAAATVLALITVLVLIIAL